MKPYEESLLQEKSNKTLNCFMVETQQLAPYWHCHEEYELSFVLSGHGKRFVGNHVDNFDHGDLLLTGKYLPHDRITNVEDSSLKKVLVIHFNKQTFASVPELAVLSTLFEKAKYGVLFHYKMLP